LRRQRLRYAIDNGVFRATPTTSEDGAAHDALVSVDVDPSAFEAEWLRRVIGAFGGTDPPNS
jgi:hypothetical protein